MSLLRPGVAVFLAALCVACDTPSEPAGPARPNLLIVVADDLGTDRVGIYGESSVPVHTPNLDALGREGLVFRDVWSMPACSPTRAALLTGRLPHRTGIGSVLGIAPHGRHQPSEEVGLSDQEDTIARAVKDVGYASALVGKWHLGSERQGLDHPLRLGFDHHRGSFGNLGIGRGYFQWTKLVDGVPERSTTYATTDTTNDAIDLARQLPQPWLIVVMYNAPHAPAHRPPPELHSYRNLTDPGRQQPVAFLAMLEALDTEIGRLIEGVAPFDPFVFFLGDNGTPKWAYPEGKRGRGKSSLFDSNLRVPLIVKHPSIVSPGRRVDAPASVTDLFATVLDLSGAAAAGHPPSPDSVSLRPYFESDHAPDARQAIVAERFWPNGHGPRRVDARAARDRHYKLVREKGHPERFYDLVADPGERAPIPVGSLSPEQRQAYLRLATLLAYPRPAAAAPHHPAQDVPPAGALD